MYGLYSEGDGWDEMKVVDEEVVKLEEECVSVLARGGGKSDGAWSLPT